MIEVTIPNAEKLERDLNLVRANMLADLKREMQRITIDLSAEIKGNKLSGQVLNVKTGRLRRSINQRVTETSTGVEGLVGTNVEYARVHEFGFTGTVNVKEHMRGKKERFKVRAHTRRVKLPERSFLRSSLREMRPEIDARIARVIGTSIARSGKGA